MEKNFTMVKRYLWVVPSVALAVVILFTASRRFAATSGEHANGPEMNATPLTNLTLANETRGVVFMTAAINANGSIASCFSCSTSNTKQIATGEYQVAFNTTVTANSGYSRWVQVDTLTTGSINNVSCTTADRSGSSTAVYVQCSNNTTGDAEDTSFFLFVAR
jgi:hypothetical protein